MPTRKEDLHFMSRALDLASRGLGSVQPNPAVGAIITRGGKILGEGYHKGFGQPHAEVEALKSLREDPRGSTMYVTLEPCSHTGKTPPCTEAILKAGISEVVFACEDFNPKASGGGNFLQSRGVQVRQGILRDRARVLNEQFFHSLSHNAPFLCLKLALTLDGKIARKDGTSQWITGQEARAEVHRRRAQYQAIHVGVDTLIQDDPQLNVRMTDGNNPVRVILDPRGRLSSCAKVFQDAQYLYFSRNLRKDLMEDRQEALLGDTYESHWTQVLSSLHQRKIQGLFVEGGARVAEFLLSRGQVQRMLLFYGPHWFGNSGLEGFQLSFEGQLEQVRTCTFGESVLLEGVPKCSQD